MRGWRKAVNPTSPTFSTPRILAGARGKWTASGSIRTQMDPWPPDWPDGDIPPVFSPNTRADVAPDSNNREGAKYPLPNDRHQPHGSRTGAVAAVLARQPTWLSARTQAPKGLPVMRTLQEAQVEMRARCRRRAAAMQAVRCRRPAGALRVQRHQKHAPQTEPRVGCCRILSQSDPGR